MMKSIMGSRHLFVVIAMGLVGAACDNGGSAPATPASAAAPASASAAPKVPASASAAAAAPSASAGPTDAGPAGNADAEAAQDEVVSDELQAHHRHQHAAFAGFVMSAVETLGIAPEQQSAIDGFRKEYRAKMKPVREANGAVLQALADGIGAGTIDKAKVDAADAKLGAAAAAAQPATQNLLGQLHGALRPEQRAALVDKVDAHFAAWRDANERHAADPSKPDPRLRHLTKELTLTQDQVDKVRASLDASKDDKKPFDAAATEAYLKAFDAAFVAEKFEASKLPAAGPDAARMIAWGTGRMAAIYQALTPVLTPAQRATLADKLHQRAAALEPKEKP